MARTLLKKRRINKGLTQERVAESAGISRAFYTEIEGGSKNCSMEKWLKIAACLDIPESKLIAYISEGIKKGA